MGQWGGGAVGLSALAASDAAAERTARDSYPFVVLRLTMHDLLGSIETGCADALKHHEAVPPQSYLDNARYRYLVAESLDTALMARSKLRWWLEGSNTLDFVRARPLRRAHRDYLMSCSRRGRRGRGLRCCGSLCRRGPTRLRGRGGGIGAR